MNTIPTEGKVIVQFGAKWCSPCKQIRPFVEETAELMNVPFLYLDMEEDMNMAQRLAIRAMPSIIVLENGQEVGRVSGANMREIALVLGSAFKT